MGTIEPIKTYLALCTAVLFWGLSFVATKIALQSIPVLPLIFTRFALAGLLFAAVSLPRGIPRFTRADHGRMLLLALFEPGLYFYFETVGLAHTSASKAALIIAAVPLAVLIFSAYWLGERTSSKGIAGAFLSVAGIGGLIAGDPNACLGLAGPLLGDLCMVVAVFSATFYILCARSLGQRYSASDITGMQIVYGALFFAPFFVSQLPDIDWSAVQPEAFAALVYLVLGATVAAFYCYNYALTRTEAYRAAVFINAIPLVTTVGAWILLDEVLSGLQILGGGCVLAGVCLANLRPRRRA